MLDNKFLHMQLISKAKTNQSLLKVSFREGFSLSTNVKHYSNEKESLHEFLRRYHLTEHPARTKELWVWKQKSPHDLWRILDQITDKALKRLGGSNILVAKVLSKMTYLFQPLDLTANKVAKSFTNQIFSAWFTRQINIGSENRQDLDDIKID